MSLLHELTAFFGRRRLRQHQRINALTAEIEQRRHAAALHASLHGADVRPGANCDTELHHKFVALENDYCALEKENASLRVDAMLGAAFRRLLVNTSRYIQRGE